MPIGIGTTRTNIMAMAQGFPGNTNMETLEEEEKKIKKEEVANNGSNGGGGAPVPPPQGSSNSSSSLAMSLNKPNFSGTYGKMVMVPYSVYDTMMNSGKDPVQNLHQNLIRQQVEEARKNANNPVKYRHYMVQANVLRRNTVANPNIDQRIQLSLNDPQIQKIDAELHRLGRDKNLIKTNAAQKRYRALQIDKNTRLNVLQTQENQRYSSLVNNPSDSTTPTPASLSNKSYHVNTLRAFLQRHPNLIRQDSSRHVYVENERVTSQANPQNLPHILHYLMQDYETQRSLSDNDYSKQLPKGLLQFVRALHRRGFNYSDIGNKYLRDRLSSGLMKTEAAAAAAPGARRRTIQFNDARNAYLQQQIEKTTRNLHKLEGMMREKNISESRAKAIREKIKQNQNIYQTYKREFDDRYQSRIPTLTPTPHASRKRILPTPTTTSDKRTPSTQHEKKKATPKPQPQPQPSPPTTPKPSYNFRRRRQKKKSNTDK